MGGPSSRSHRGSNSGEQHYRCLSIPMCFDGEQRRIKTDKQNNDFGRRRYSGIDAICCKSGNRVSKSPEQSWAKLHRLHQAAHVK